MEQPWVIIVAISPKASDWQSEASELPVRLDGLKTTKFTEIRGTGR
jgi:hypothetical protein